MNQKTVSSKAIIAKIYRDLKPKDSSWELDAIEWIGEAMEFIGYFTGFELKERFVRVNDFRSPLPADLYTLLGVRIGRDKLPCENPVETFNIGTVKDIIFRTTEFSGDVGFSQLTLLTNHYYYQEPNYIKTSFKSGGVRLQYLAFPTDEQGYPEVPDNIYVRQAIEWYILSRMILGGYEHRFLSFQEADHNWKKYCVSAQNDLAYPSVDKMDLFMDRWVRMIPDIQKSGVRAPVTVEITDQDKAATCLPGNIGAISFKDQYWQTDGEHGSIKDFEQGLEGIYES